MVDQWARALCLNSRVSGVWSLRCGPSSNKICRPRWIVLPLSTERHIQLQRCHKLEDAHPAADGQPTQSIQWQPALKLYVNVVTNPHAQVWLRRSLQCTFAEVLMGCSCQWGWLHHSLGGMLCRWFGLRPLSGPYSQWCGSQPAWGSYYCETEAEQDGSLLSWGWCVSWVN
jgi:hypothetical protein